jgi:hypothetical protein
MSGKIKSFKMAPAGVVDVKEDLKTTRTVMANNRADPYPPVKTSGIRMKGAGAATKGVICRGPMA